MARRGVRPLGNRTLTRGDGIEWIVDDKSAQAAIKTMLRNVDDFRKHWEPIIDAINESNAQRFESQDGGTWAPLANRKPSYAAWKAKHYPGGKILQATGELLDVMTNKKNKNQRIVRGQKELRLYYFRNAHRGGATNAAGRTNLASIHQGGKGKMPARKVINENSPLLRKAMGDAAGEVAKAWAAEWEAGRGS